MAITTFTQYDVNNEIRDDESGILVKYHTEGQREHYLLRHPEMAGRLPPVVNPHAYQAPVAPTVVGGRTWYAPETAREAALLRDHAPVRSTPTKPRAATELSKYRLCLHEASHACLANLAFGRPIVRVTINPTDDGMTGHAWNYHQGDANRDDLVIVAAGRVAEEELLGGVYEVGCGGDDATRRKLALKLSDGDSDAADTLLRKTEASARTLVKQYDKTIRRFALRLAAKREFVLDEAETAIRQAHEDVTQRAVLDDEWRMKIARAQASAGVRKYKEQQSAKAAPKKERVVRTLRADVPEEAAELARMLGVEPGRELIGYTHGWVK